MQKNTDQMNPFPFVALHLLLALTAGKLFLAFGFGGFYPPFSIEKVTGDQVLVLLAVLVLTMTVGGCWLTFRRFRYFWSVLIDVISPYTVLIMLRHDLAEGVLVWAISGLFLLGRQMWLLMKGILRSVEGGGWRHTGRRMYRSLCRYHVIACSLLCMTAMLIGIVYTAGLPSLRWLERETALAAGSLELADGQDMKRYLAEVSWEDLTTADKETLLNKVVQVEGQYLGLTVTPLLKMEELPEFVWGSYNPRKETIAFNRDQLEEGSMGRCVKIILHEMFHAYQWQLCSVYRNSDPELRAMWGFRRAAVYAREFTDYERGRGGYEAYQNQACETDARAYANMRISCYVDGYEEEMP